MMNLDMVRVGEGVVGAKKKKSKDKNVELGADADAPALFESDEKPLRIKVPEGWSVDERP